MQEALDRFTHQSEVCVCVTHTFLQRSDLTHQTDVSLRFTTHIRSEHSVLCVCVRTPVVAGVPQGSVAGDTLALPLVEGVQGVRIVAGPPAAGT